MKPEKQEYCIIESNSVEYYIFMKGGRGSKWQNHDTKVFWQAKRDELKFIRWNLAGFNIRFSDQKQENKQAFNRIST